jgi:hypothetical protein
MQNVTAASYCKFLLQNLFDTKYLYSQNNISRTNHSCHEAKQNFANLEARNSNTKSNNNFLIGSSQHDM